VTLKINRVLVGVTFNQLLVLFQSKLEKVYIYKYFLRIDVTDNKIHIYPAGIF